MIFHGEGFAALFVQLQKEIIRWQFSLIDFLIKSKMWKWKSKKLSKVSK